MRAHTDMALAKRYIEIEAGSNVPNTFLQVRSDD